MEKTNKQKCIETWEWLAKNPSEDKEDYEDYLMRRGRLEEYHYCWACVTAYQRQRHTDKLEFSTRELCDSCPLDFKTEPKNITYNSVLCHNEGTAYDNWLEHKTTENAEAMVKLIKETWEGV